VFEDSVRPLVEHALGGGHATAFMFGQTGSGKTYTMGAMYERAARLCFPPLEGGGGGGGGGEGGGVYVSFVELAGEGAGRDLLVSRSRAPPPGPAAAMAMAAARLSATAACPAAGRAAALLGDPTAPPRPPPPPPLRADRCDSPQPARFNGWPWAAVVCTATH
jgi:hypothetical protein